MDGDDEPERRALRAAVADLGSSTDRAAAVTAFFSTLNWMSVSSSGPRWGPRDAP